MAQANRMQSTTITFGIKGMDEIYSHQKKMKDLWESVLKARKKELDEMAKGSSAWEAQKKVIEETEKQYKSFTNQANALLKVLENPMAQSGQKVQQAVKAIQQGLNKIKFTDKDGNPLVGDALNQMEKAMRVYAQLTRELTAQYSSMQAGTHDMTKALNVQRASYSELSAAVQNYERNGRAWAESQKNSAQAFAEAGKNATEYKIRMGQLDGTLLAVNKNTKPETLQAYIKGWQDIAKYGGASAEQIQRANENIAKAESLMRDRMQRRVENAGKSDLAGKQYYSPAQVREAVEYMKQYADTTKMSTAEREKWNASIMKGEQYLKQLTLEQQKYAMQEQLGGKTLSQIKALSDAAISSQKKYWTDMVQGAERGTAEYDTYLATLKAVTTEEQRRASEKVRMEGGQLVGQVNAGAFQGTIKETEEAIQKIQAYKKELGTSDTKALTDANNALNTLNEALAKTKQEVIDGGEAFKGLKNAAKQGVDEVAAQLPRSTEELKKMRENLEAYKKSLKSATPEQLQQINTVLTAIDKKQKEVASSEINWAQYKGGELKKRSLDELKRAYDTLKKEIESLSPAQQGYNEKAMQMRQIDQRIKSMNKNLGHHVSSLENAASRLKNYVMIYLGFNAVMMKTRQLMSDVMKLSDQMVNVQKVTQMTNNEVERLVKSIQDLDTRSSTESLMAFAEQAGKLGIYTKNGLEGMKQFVEIGDRISKTLGEDIGGAQAIADLAKVNDIMNVTTEVMKRTGNEATVMRDALNATGSAILNVGNNSAASYGAITEYVGRLGAISASSGIAIQETVALGGALDALKMPAEAGSTALSQFINAIVRNTDAMAQAAKVSVVEMRNLIANGQTYKAVTLLLSKVADGTTTAQKLMDAMTGRSRTNVNIRNVIQLLSGHMELLNKQLEYAQSGFESAFSQKTANDVQLISNALKSIGKEGSLTDILSLYRQIKDGTYDVKTSAEDLSKSGHDVDMLTQALNNTVIAMSDLDKQGKLNVDTMSALAVSTGQASVMEQEFERVNESAAARFERLGRMIHELLVNEESVKFWSDMSKGLMDFIEWMQSGETGARRLGTALTMLITYLIAVRMNVERLIAVDLWGTLKKWYIAIQALVTGTTNWTKAWNGLKAAMASNWFTLAATLIAGIVYWIKSAADESSRFAKATAEVKDALLDERREAALLFAQLQNLNMTEDERGRIIERINSKYGTLIGYMIDENTKGQALARTYELINAKLREKAKLQLQDELMKEAGKTGSEKIKSGITDLAQKSDVYFGEDVKKSAAFQTKAFDYINRAIASNPNQTAEQVTASVMKALKKENIALPYKGQERSMQELGVMYAIRKIAEGQLEQTRATQRVSRFISGQEMTDRDANQQVFVGNLRETNKEIKSTLETFRDKKDNVTDEQLNKALQSMNRILNDKDIMGSVKKGSVDEKIVQSFRYYVRQMSAEQTRRAGITPWGDSSTVGKAMEDWTTEALQAYHKKLSNTAIAAAPNADWSQIFPDIIGLKQGMTVQEVQKFVDEEDEKVQEILKSRHMGLTDFHHYKDKENKKGQKEKDEFEAAIAELDRYYKDRETLIEIALNNEEITESEANRRKESLEAEHLSKRSQLRRDAIGRMDDGEMKEFENWWDSVEELDKVNFKRLREQSDLWGKAYVQKVALAASKDLSEIEKMLQEHKKKIDKILQEGDDVKKVTDAFKAAMDDLDMIFAIREEEASRTAALGNQRANQLMEWSKKAYSMEVSDLKAAMQETGNIYHAWFEALGNDQDRTLQAMLVRLRQYHDDMDEVVRKAAKERKRLFDMVYNNAVGEDGMTNQQRNTAQTDHAQSAISGQQLSQRWGYGGDNLTNNAELNLINLQIEQKLKYIEALKEQLEYETALSKQSEEALERQIEAAQSNPALSGGEYSPEEKAQAEAELADLQNQLAQKRQDTANLELETNVLLADSEKELTELRTEQVDKQIENYQRMFDYLKEIQGEFEGFAESFGEGIFGSKEDRKNAALDLVADVLKTTKQVTQAYLTEIATKKIADNTIVAMEQQKNVQLAAQRSQSLSNYGATKVAELTAEGAVAEAGNTTAIAEGTQKEVAKHGLAGLATAAAIGVGLSLLLGLALGALSKARSATASATGASSGVGKLATGMLTYAKGRYPVYGDGSYGANGMNGQNAGQLVSVPGNDGKTYMAKYQPNLRTGVVSSPHLGIVGEKGAELIVDHQTYEGLKRYDPDTLRRIYAMKAYGTRSIDFSRTARMGNEVVMNRGGVRAYAEGNVMDKLEGMGVDESEDRNGTLLEMKQTLSDLTVVLSTIKKTGIHANVDYFGRSGLHETDQRGQKFLKKKGVTT